LKIYRLVDIWFIVYNLLNSYSTIGEEWKFMISLMSGSVIMLLTPVLYLSYRAEKIMKELNFANNLLNKWKYVDALIEYVKYRGSDMFAIYNSWLCLENLKCYEEAIMYYDDFIVKNPSYIDAYFHKSFCFENMKQYHKALEQIEKCILLDDKNNLVYYKKWSIFKWLNQIQNSIIAFEEWIKLDKENNDITFAAYFTLARLYEDTNQIEKALDICDKWIKLFPQRSSFCNFKFLLLINSGNNDLAFTELLFSIEKFSDEKLFYESMLSFVLSDKNYLSRSKELIVFYDSYIKKYFYIENKIHYIIWGECLQHQNKFQEALDVYNSVKVEDLPIKLLHIYYNNVWYSYTKKNDHRNAYNYFKKAIKSKSDFAIWYYNKANAELFIWDYDHMFFSLEKAFDLDNQLVKKIIDDKDFDSIRDDERYKKLMQSSS